MAEIYIGVNGTAHKTKNIYVGEAGIARKVKKGYVGIDGKARLFYESSYKPTQWIATSVPPIAYYSVAFGNGRFAVATYDPDGSSSYSGSSMYSDDGISWNNAIKNPGRGNPRMAYGDGVFIVTSPQSPDIASSISPDGISWEPSHIDIQSEGIAYNNGMFVIVSGYYRRNSSLGNSIVYSTDRGSSWTHAYDGTVFVGDRIAYGKDKFVTVTGAYSYDGKIWNIEKNTLFSENADQDIAYGDGPKKFVITRGLDIRYGGDSDSLAYYSADGITWHTTTIPKGYYLGVTYGNGMFMTIGNINHAQGGQAVCAYSYDGIEWAEIPMPGAIYRDIAFGDNTFVAVGESYISYMKV